MKIRAPRCLLFVCFSLFAGSGLLAGEDRTLGESEKDLLATRKKLKELKAQASASEADVFKFKDRVVYSNTAVRVIYEEMKALEKQFIDQKSMLENEIMKLPEYRDLIKKRNDAFSEVRKLKEEELFILKHIEQLRREKRE